MAVPVPNAKGSTGAFNCTVIDSYPDCGVLSVQKPGNRQTKEKVAAAPSALDRIPSPSLSWINHRRTGSRLMLRDKIRQGEQVRRHLLERRRKNIATKGLTTEDILLPHCECLLIDLFTEMFHINKE